MLLGGKIGKDFARIQFKLVLVIPEHDVKRRQEIKLFYRVISHINMSQNSICYVTALLKLLPSFHTIVKKNR